MMKHGTCESLTEIVSVISNVTVTLPEDVEIRHLPRDKIISHFNGVVS